MSFMLSAVLTDRCLQGRRTHSTAVPEHDKRIRGSCNIEVFLALFPWFYGFWKDLRFFKVTLKSHSLTLYMLDGGGQDNNGISAGISGILIPYTEVLWWNL